MTLLQRVVAGNALVVFVGALILAVSPATVSPRITGGEAALLAGGAVVAVLANMVVMRRALAPLRALAGEMAAVDLAAPPAVRSGPPREGVAEVAALGRAFDTMLVRLAAERQDSARAAIAAQERERARIGRELHDEVGQALTGVALELRAGELEAAQEALTAAADGVREIMQGLRPEALEDFGLRGALLALASAFAERTGVSPRRDLDQLPALPEETELVVYRVVQEALTNVARHAEGFRSVSLSARHEGDMVVLVIDDDGAGRRGAAPGTGLAGMRERALLAGGTLMVSDRDGGGTVVRLEVRA
ncbi:sensor histidine kinase [Conexibacter woesei]|uniref:sensor histidine kinase n=1 Tax=Conexibacter woesei TaxID=191495 RepID=UPI000414D3D5|nr:histidine kinase [Conexibacter woesei]